MPKCVLHTSDSRSIIIKHQVHRVLTELLRPPGNLFNLTFKDSIRHDAERGNSKIIQIGNVIERLYDNRSIVATNDTALLSSLAHFNLNRPLHFPAISSARRCLYRKHETKPLQANKINALKVVGRIAKDRIENPHRTCNPPLPYRAAIYRCPTGRWHFEMNDGLESRCISPNVVSPPI